MCVAVDGCCRSAGTVSTHNNYLNQVTSSVLLVSAGEFDSLIGAVLSQPNISVKSSVTFSRRGNSVGVTEFNERRTRRTSFTFGVQVSMFGNSGKSSVVLIPAGDFNSLITSGRVGKRILSFPSWPCHTLPNPKL